MLNRNLFKVSMPAGLVLYLLISVSLAMICTNDKYINCVGSTRRYKASLTDCSVSCLSNSVCMTSAFRDGDCEHCAKGMGQITLRNSQYGSIVCQRGNYSSFNMLL